MAIEEELIHKAMLAGGNILDDELNRNYHCETNKMLLMMSRTQALHARGNFCWSFKLWKNGLAADAKPSKCVRVWKGNALIDNQRFRLISDYLRKVQLPYFTDFRFVEHGVRVGGVDIPAIFMDWIDGDTLTEWIPVHRKQPDQLRKLADKFMRMCGKLNSLGMAHGDLCCENILVTSAGEIKLVDYDSIYVPAMQDRFHAVTAGWDDFQHPRRSNNTVATARDDYFSQHVIYLSLLAYARFSSLVPEEPEKAMLFTQADYANGNVFAASRAYRYITQHANRGNGEDDILLKELDVLRRAVAGSFDQVPPLEELRGGGESQVRYVPYCVRCGYKFPGNTEKYCHRCGASRLIFK